MSEIWNIPSPYKSGAQNHLLWTTSQLKGNFIIKVGGAMDLAVNIAQCELITHQIVFGRRWGAYDVPRTPSQGNTPSPFCTPSTPSALRTPGLARLVSSTPTNTGDANGQFFAITY